MIRRYAFVNLIILILLFLLSQGQAVVAQETVLRIHQPALPDSVAIDGRSGTHLSSDGRAVGYGTDQSEIKPVITVIRIVAE